MRVLYRKNKIRDLQASSTAGVVGNVRRPDVAYNVRMAPPPPPSIGVILPPAANPNGVRSVQNANVNNIGLQIPTPPKSGQPRPTIGKLGGSLSSDTPTAS